MRRPLQQDGRSATVKPEGFIIPNPDLVPAEVRSKVKRWSDYIDFWAVESNYQGDAFHNEWRTYRTRKSPTLRLISNPHTYTGPGDYRILVKVIVRTLPVSGLFNVSLLCSGVVAAVALRSYPASPRRNEKISASRRKKASFRHCPAPGTVGFPSHVIV